MFRIEHIGKRLVVPHFQSHRARLICLIMVAFVMKVVLRNTIDLISETAQQIIRVLLKGIISCHDPSGSFQTRLPDLFISRQIFADPLKQATINARMWCGNRQTGHGAW